MLHKIGTIKVCNGKQSGFIWRDSIYISRQNIGYELPQIPLANPYVIGKDGSRSQVIELYRKWLWQHIKSWQDEGNINPVVAELLTIRDRIKNGDHITLTCWCHPLPCHGDVIICCVKWLISQGY